MKHYGAKRTMLINTPRCTRRWHTRIKQHRCKTRSNVNVDPEVEPDLSGIEPPEGGDPTAGDPTALDALATPIGGEPRDKYNEIKRILQSKRR